jgi:hypothetical protein
MTYDRQDIFPRSNAIPAEVYKAGGPCLGRKLTQLFQHIQSEETIPQEYKDASVVHLYKKGNRRICDNHRGFSLLSLAGKVLACIRLNRPVVHIDQGLLSESQCGFRKERGTNRHDICCASTFVNLTKAFSRKDLWKIMTKYGCPEKFIHIWCVSSMMSCLLGVLTTA